MKQRLGQHFLINKSAIKKIVSALDLQNNDTVIEIGPGKGALTEPLITKLQNCKIAKLILIEKDPALVYKLKSLKNKIFPNLEIVGGDALKIIPELISNQQSAISNYKIVGNIPYYITGKLLRILGDLITQLPDCPITNIVLMLQKEVAERICAEPPRMNLLAAAVQFWAEPKILFSLKSGDFQPPQKVQSAVIKLTPKPYTLNPENYYKLIKILFKQPRKTLLNNLQNGLKIPKEKIRNELKKQEINPEIRPQNLRIKQIESLTNLFTSFSWL